MKGFEDAVTKPVEAAVGAGDPQGNAKTFQLDATVVSGFIGCAQFSTTEDDKTLFDARVVGFLQTGGAAHVILLTQPAAVVVPFEVNTNVKHPLAAEEVNEGGKVVPDKFARSGAVVSLPSYIFKKSVLACVLNEVKVTVTTSPAFTGHIVVV